MSDVEQRAVRGHEKVDGVDSALAKIDSLGRGMTDQHGAEGCSWLGQGCSRNSSDGGGDVFESAIAFKRNEVPSVGQCFERNGRRGQGNVMQTGDRVGEEFPLDSTPDAMRCLARVGMTSREACSNTVRNITACSLSGVCPREHVDVTKHVGGVVKHFLRNPLNQQLPRKFKISFSACESDCAQAMLHDCGVVAVNKNGRHGFMVRAAGGLGHKPREAIVVEEFIPEHELLFAVEALVTLHNKYSDRTKRAKSRIKFLVERFGEQGFLEKYREEFERTRQALAGQPYPKGEWRAQTGGQAPGQGAPRKLLAQHQAGLFVFPIALPIGDITPVQLHGIAALLRAHGLSEIRTSQDQNLTIFNVPQAKVSFSSAALLRMVKVAPFNCTICFFLNCENKRLTVSRVVPIISAISS